MHSELGVHCFPPFCGILSDPCLQATAFIRTTGKSDVAFYAKASSRATLEEL
jgi:hypothetical protein